MGINGLIPELPGGSMDCLIFGFSKLKSLKDRSCPVDIDMGSLVYVCAFRHKETYNIGDYVPAAREFQRNIIMLNLVHNWDYVCVFDGRPPAEKRFEHQRRQQRGNNKDRVVINSTFIAICANVCRRHYVKFVVAPAEADMQVGRCRDGSAAVCNDSDLIAYGLPLVVFVQSWGKEESRIVDMKTPVSDEMKDSLPLYFYYGRYGLRIIHWWAAVMGCDISVSESGITHAGRGCFLKAIRSFDEKDPDDLDSRSFSVALRNCSTTQCRASWSAIKIQSELDRVVKWFTSDATYYDVEGNLRSVSGSLVKATSRSLVRHMCGELDPKTATLFSADQKRKIESIQCHNLQQNSSARHDKIRGLSLPPGRTKLADCLVTELKAMVVARGGSVTAKDGKPLRAGELKQVLASYLSMESENSMHFVYFNRAKSNNGIFATIDTSERKTVPQIINSLIDSNMEPSLHRFFVDISHLLHEDRFTDDYATIALQAPELKESFIHESFVHVGENKTQKSIVSGLQRVLEIDKLLYHANASSNDGKSIYLLSKQRASQTRDEKTRNKTAPGEKPKLQEYLVMMQCMVVPTTIESHGHTLGAVDRIMRSYCAQCVAGCGMCYHRACCLWMQHLHWGEGRPTPKPATTTFCSWIPGSKAKRSCSTLLPATKMNIMQLPKSNEEAAARLERGRKGNIMEGLSAVYDVFGGDENKQAMLNDSEYTSARRISFLFRQLELAQNVDE